MLDMSLDQCACCGGFILPEEFWDWDVSPDCKGNIKFRNSGAFCSAFTDEEIEAYESFLYR